MDGRWVAVAGRLDAPAVSGLLENRFEASEILRRTAQRDRVDKTVIALDQRDGFDGIGVIGFVVQRTRTISALLPLSRRRVRCRVSAEVNEPSGVSTISTSESSDGAIAILFCGGTSMAATVSCGQRRNQFRGGVRRRQNRDRRRHRRGVARRRERVTQSPTESDTLAAASGGGALRAEAAGWVGLADLPAEPGPRAMPRLAQRKTVVIRAFMTCLLASGRCGIR